MRKTSSLVLGPRPPLKGGFLVHMQKKKETKMVFKLHNYERIKKAKVWKKIHYLLNEKKKKVRTMESLSIFAKSPHGHRKTISVT